MTDDRRRFEGSELIVASHNAGKISEIGDLLAPFGVASIGADALGLDEPEETGADFIANAELKARAAALATGRPALADDSGLAVDALDGAPGIYSARWAQTPDGVRDFNFAMRKVETALSQKPDAPRTARFICALSLVWPDGHAESFEGQVAGTLVWPMRGGNGFGYDPVFLPLGGDLTWEMTPQAKHAISTAPMLLPNSWPGVLVADASRLENAPALGVTSTGRFVRRSAPIVILMFIRCAICRPPTGARDISWRLNAPKPCARTDPSKPFFSAAAHLRLCRRS